MGSVTIERTKAIWRDRARAYSVNIDGRTVGKIASGERQTYDLALGPHEVRMKIDWCGSPAVIVDGANDTALVCEAGGNSFTAIWDLLFRTSQYISLEFRGHNRVPGTQYLTQSHCSKPHIKCG